MLSNYGIEIIFIDEFSINSWSHKIYGWTEKEKKALTYKYLGSEFFALSLDYPQKDSIHLRLNNTTIDSTIFWQYLEELIKEQKEVEFSDKNFVLLPWDNTTIYKTKIVRELLVEHKWDFSQLSPTHLGLILPKDTLLPLRKDKDSARKKQVADKDIN